MHNCSQPTSPASRGTILTGLHPHRSGVTGHKIPLSEDVPTFVELLKDPDYEKAYMGLWVLGNEIDRQHGFDTWVSIEDGYRNNPKEKDCGGRQSSYADFLSGAGFRQDDVKRDLPIFSRYFFHAPSGTLQQTGVPGRDRRPIHPGQPAASLRSVRQLPGTPPAQRQRQRQSLRSR